MRWRPAGCAAGLAVGAALAALGAAELALRLFAPQALLHDPDAFLPDPNLGARLKPGFADRVVTTEFSSTWAINVDGYRGPRAGSRGPADLRVVTLGDSFTFGYGVEEEQAWPRQLERLLDEGSGPSAAGVEVLNLGVGGYGTWQEAAWLEEKAPSLKPDLVVLGFYVGNDPADNARAARAARASHDGGEGGATPAEAGGSRTERLKRWLGSRVHLYALVSTRGDELLVRLGLRQLVYPFEMEILRPRETPEVSEAWRSTQPALTRLAVFSRRTGTPVMVVVIPMKHQVSEPVWRRLVAHYAGEWDRDRPQRLMRDMLGVEGLEEIDLLEGLRQEAAREPNVPLYWARDQHWSAAGHAAAARLIAGGLRKGILADRLRGSGSE